ncbi:VOC family protein [Colwellia psychrerythraea]|uniref:Glyoxalase/bleomycin resistance protein/dioxygenase n=1 Tax=Colwellia psychrerythraea TaxID=28229 RepID=A0A099KXD7_COLPS|nr:VOC family protein [Colwellia psychrerythraea]KGJ95384.1 Glyoxalase/bleomycin resistance protein/dioxygenase [Colwellia psychrerythraea]
MINIEKIHHVAYRCKDAKETTNWYKDKLNMDLVLAIAENEVPSTKAPDPYMHIFLDAGNENVLAFFELPNSPTMDRDQNTPDWVQHIALRVASYDALVSAKEELESKGIEILGPVNHGVFKSIYFFDPNGHRLELAADTGTEEQYKELNKVAHEMIEEWSVTKRAPRHAAWLHEQD